MRGYSFIDKVLMQVDAALNTILGSQFSSRSNPADGIVDGELSAADKRQSQGFMRVNHTGEVCAQALYRGQLLFAEDNNTTAMLQQAAIEETDHLAWTHQRLQELNTHRSYLNFFWYINSFCMGMLAAKCGDRWSLGFVEETEKQVSDHLTDHLKNLSPQDLRSHAIIKQMRVDEEHHGAQAQQAGATKLPSVVKTLMSCHAAMMKKLAYSI